VNPLLVYPESALIILETEIKSIISKAYENHQYHGRFLRFKILKDNLRKTKEDLETF